MTVLDSCAIIHILNGSEIGRNLKDRIGQNTVCTTSINLDEVLRECTEAAQAKAWPFFALLDILSFDDKAALTSINLNRLLKKKGKPLSHPDRMIASICISRDLTLITSDQDFKDVPGLKLILVG